jgi:hypothetical protein
LVLEQALGKTGRKPGFSTKFKVAVPILYWTRAGEDHGNTHAEKRKHFA